MDAEEKALLKLLQMLGNPNTSPVAKGKVGKLLDVAIHIIEVIQLYYIKFSLFAKSFVSGGSGQ